MKKVILLLTIFLLCFNTAYALEKLVPYVNDFAVTMTAEQQEDLNNFATEIDNKTGYEIVLVTVASTDEMTALQYAQALGDYNKIGKKGLNNGIVILWNTNTQRGAVATGEGAKKVLSDELVTSFGVKNKALFLSGDVHGAFGNIMREIFVVLKPDEAANQADPLIVTNGAGGGGGF